MLGYILLNNTNRLALFKIEMMLKNNRPTAEEERLQEDQDRVAHWKRWGPYLSERAWGTVREDYSADGDAWRYFTHDQARSKAYRWSEDGIAGISDRHQYICFAIALWNGQDAILKERLFGLTGKEGNHGEDVKEYYFYQDNLPSHAYMKFLYKYPQTAFPYEQLVAENAKRSRYDAEYELLDTGVFEDNRYFDVSVVYAKADINDILICIEVVNRGSQPAQLDLLPTIWFRNTWAWDTQAPKPALLQKTFKNVPNIATAELQHVYYGKYWLHCQGHPTLLFTENETNTQRLYGVQNKTPYVKDSIHEYLVKRIETAVNPAHCGTKMSAHYRLQLEPGESQTVCLRLTDQDMSENWETIFGPDFGSLFQKRQQEADDFYHTVTPEGLSEAEKQVMRQAFAGLLWSKQFYHYEVRRWLQGDITMPKPPEQRLHGRNHQWTHMFNEDIISMPDKWEYPWFAAWDLAFHSIPLAMVDPDFAKEQLLLLLSDWYLHPNGQLPAYEWNFNDVNPPIHAWAAWRVFDLDRKRTGKSDYCFLEKVFQKLLLNFTWWVNREDPQGLNVFQGGILGLDNIGIFNRSEPLPMGGTLEQSDGTSWMAMYTLSLLRIAVELAVEDSVYDDMACKFWEHFLYIAHAMNQLGQNSIGMWDDQDGFYYDVVLQGDGNHFPLKIRSILGLIPLFAVEVIESERLAKLPKLTDRMKWFQENRPDLIRDCACMGLPQKGGRSLVSTIDDLRLRDLLKWLLDEAEFLSPYGVRSLSRVYRDQPYQLNLYGEMYQIDYEPAESTTGLFGGNSNWRGPVWLPLNYLIIESLLRFYHYYGEVFKVECPTGSGTWMTLYDVAEELAHRVLRIFLPDATGRRPVYGGTEAFQSDPLWKDNLLFFEYFHGDNGAGIGASHQTGWTALVAALIQQFGTASNVSTSNIAVGAVRSQ